MRIHRDEQGFAMITAVAIMAIIAVLLIVALTAGQSAYTNSEQGSRWTKTLSIAEAGVNDAITAIAANRTASPTCPIGSTLIPACDAPGGQYRWSRSTQADGNVIVNSIGYFPSEADAEYTRQIQVLLEPIPTFRYAIFSESTLDIKNGVVVQGDIYSKGAVTIGQNAIVCGSVLNTQGGVMVGLNAQITKTYSTTCSGKSGQVWAGGTINDGVGAIIQGDAKASAGSSVPCPPTPNTNYAILGGTVQGTATACGTITATAASASPNTQSDPPAEQSMPSYTFDAANYPGLHCYAIDTSTCSDVPSNWSATAVNDFNTGVSKLNMQGTYVIWQQNPAPGGASGNCQGGKVCLDGLSVSGDTTIITNAPIDMGNTSNVTTSVPANLTIISLYIPPAGTDCNTSNPTYCSIYAKNSVTFDKGDPSDPNDGIAVMLYTPGKMSFKNTGGSNSSGDGALYAGSMDIKNGFDVTYNSRIERLLGFGVGLERTLWQEVPG